MKVGDIKKGKYLGYSDTHQYVYQACYKCGMLRWVKLIKGSPICNRCIQCSNGDISNSRRDTIRKIWTGRKHTGKSKQKIKLAHVGMKHSEETCKIISNALKGNKYNWKGGITALEQSIRNMPEYIKWRTSIFVRDNYTCQKCGKVGGRLNVHHVKMFVQILADNGIHSKVDACDCKELWDTSNGITLCECCHPKRRKGE
jgi:hypothetical protein